MKPDASEKLLRAIVALLIDSRTSEAKDRKKDEILLSEAGLGNKEIAQILGKNDKAVGMAIARGKKK